MRGGKLANASWSAVHITAKGLRAASPEAVTPGDPELTSAAMSEANTIRDVTIPELPNHYRGKVRENYDLPDGRRIIIATDRLSAFDRAIACIPYKGQVLTQTARFCFEQTADICPNHVLDYPDPNVVVGQRSTSSPSRSWCVATSPAPPAPRS
jgi:phosphoribosylaminoimidazole-succinocarboxamide synthase